MFGIDTSFIEHESDFVPNPFSHGYVIHLPCGEEEPEDNPSLLDLSLMMRALAAFAFVIEDEKTLNAVVERSGLSHERFSEACRRAGDVTDELLA